MPSPLAHALVGASLAALPQPVARRTQLALAFAGLAVAPDLDVLGFYAGIAYEHPLGHRGVTHSLSFALVVAVLLFPLWSRLAPARSLSVAGLAFLALASHGILDAATDGGRGVGFFIPFDNERYFAPWRPIRVSPLELERLFSSRGVEVVVSELIWVALPCVLFLGGLFGLRRRWAARGG
ncbi:MAG: metal-dependent hydrolase [Myxococcales bacterium]|nr:metal-dependent hydrolase [Myxococcales bacterium]